MAAHRISIDIVRCSFWVYTFMLYPHVGYVAASAYLGLLATGARVELCTIFRLPFGALKSEYSCCCTVIALGSTTSRALVCHLLRLIAVIFFCWFGF